MFRAMMVAVLLGASAANAADGPIRVFDYREPSGAVVSFVGRDNGGWENRVGDGTVFQFQFVRRTNRFTELYDQSRNFSTIIYDDGASEWSVGKGWNNGASGSWRR